MCSLAREVTPGRQFLAQVTVMGLDELARPEQITDLLIGLNIHHKRHRRHPHHRIAVGSVPLESAARKL
jgi:hypothetical protein